MLIMIRKNSTFLILFLLFGVSVFASNPTKEKAVELFGQRHDKSKLEESIKLMEEVLSKESDYDMAALLSRAYYLLAEHADNNNQRLELYDKGVKAGEVALNLVPQYKASLSTSKKEEDAVKSITKENIDAVYWTAANLAKWVKFTSFTKKLAAKSRVKYLWDKSAELDSTYFYGGSFRFYGGYYALVPTITGEQDPVKAKVNFEKSIATAPEYLETKVLMAEAYCTHLKVKDREMFRKLLNEVLEEDLAKYPAIHAENLIAKDKAKKLLADENNLFE
jgi:hypothetical protein